MTLYHWTHCVHYEHDGDAIHVTPPPVNILLAS